MTLPDFDLDKLARDAAEAHLVAHKRYDYAREEYVYARDVYREYPSAGTENQLLLASREMLDAFGEYMGKRK